MIEQLSPILTPVMYTHVVEDVRYNGHMAGDCTRWANVCQWQVEQHTDHVIGPVCWHAQRCITQLSKKRQGSK
jgi:hypothetical protein